MIFGLTKVKTRYFKRSANGTSAIAAAKTGHRISFCLVLFGLNNGTSQLGALRETSTHTNFYNCSKSKTQHYFLVISAYMAVNLRW